MDPLHEVLVTAVRALCAERGIQLTSLPDLAGVGRSHFWEVLAGRSSPTLKWLGRVALALEVPVARLVSEPPRKQPDRLYIVRGAERHEVRVPLYTLEAAAGAFSGAQEAEVATQVTVRSGHARAERLFVMRVRGHSMEPTIPAGAYCLFRLGPVVSPEGKVILAELHDAADPELGGRYTVKRMMKKRKGAELVLTPDNPSFTPIVLDADSGVRIVAEVLDVLALPSDGR